ncbi:hypothetical protein VNO77_04298 [Canavalia gladiata]|uniref:Uncharacterized protein n=1 Tax=Canavalia gladiata TaxID=3824 RepID=A0AAN9R7M9_CANGL
MHIKPCVSHIHGSFLEEEMNENVNCFRVEGTHACITMGSSFALGTIRKTGHQRPGSCVHVEEENGPCSTHISPCVHHVISQVLSLMGITLNVLADMALVLQKNPCIESKCISKPANIAI